MPWRIASPGYELTYLKRGMEALFPSAGEPDGHELNSHGDVRGAAGASVEPDGQGLEGVPVDIL